MTQETSVQSADDADFAEKTTERQPPMGHPTGGATYPGIALIHLRESAKSADQMLFAG
ncbi:MAG: hypothetical protein U1A72_25105 [Sulfuritalea sp.]|nr:hypothetical protein [Sulfuritalea sp.]